MGNEQLREAYRDKAVLVVGMARSGIAVAQLLSSLGARCVLSDTKPNVEGLSHLLEIGCVAKLGEPAETLVAGMDYVIVSPAVPLDAPVIQAANREGIPVCSEIGLAAQLLQGKQVAITGTNGKTTTSTLLRDMLENAGRVVHLVGNVGLPVSTVVLEAKPEDISVIEVSSFQLEHMEDFHPHGAAILNLTPDHLNRHGSMEAYGALKEGMLRHQLPSDFFVYNADDAFCVSVYERAKAKCIPFARQQKLKTGAWMQDGQLVLGGRALCDVDELGPGLIGPGNLENALAAAAMASELSVPAPVIRHTLRTFAGVPNRMEYVRSHEGITYINDSKGTNPVSSVQAVRGMKGPTVLICGGEDKGISFDGFIQAIIENEHIRHVVLIGDTAEQIERLLKQAGFDACHRVGYDFAKAIDTARSLAVEGGAVLLSPACASFDMFQDFEERGAMFRQIVHALQ